MSEVHQVTTRTARKSHVCSECVTTIPAGAKYNRHHGVYEGSGYSYSMCIQCSTVHHVCYGLVEDGDDGPFFGCLVEWMQDVGEEWEVPWTPPESRLKRDIIRAAFEAIEKWRGDMELDDRIRKERSDRWKRRNQRVTRVASHEF